MGFSENVEWVADLIPDLAGRLDPFIVDTNEVDDELAEVFANETRRLTAELQDGLGRGDAETVRMAAHSIKGMGGTMGLPEISVLGQEIEIRVKTGRLADTTPLIDALAEWLSTFC